MRICYNNYIWKDRDEQDQTIPVTEINKGFDSCPCFPHLRPPQSGVELTGVSSAPSFFHTERKEDGVI